jgi:hypothetical protein
VSAEQAVTDWAKRAVGREAGVSTFLWGDQLDDYLKAVPFVWRPDAPPLPEHGLQIDRDDDGTWRTYQTRYPGSTLTRGHADNIEAFWACHALRDLCAWSTTIDLRAEIDGYEYQWAEFDRETIAGKVDRVGERFATCRAPIPGDLRADLVEPVRGVVGLAIGRLTPDGARPSDWALLVNTTGETLTGYCIPTKKAARAAAVELAALADWAALPNWLPDLLPGLKETVRRIRYRAATGKDWDQKFGGEAA